MNHHSHDTKGKQPILVCVTLLAVLTGTYGVTPQDVTDRGSLTLSMSATGHLNKRETHLYWLNLTAGQYVHVEVKGVSADVWVELTAPDGTIIMRLRALVLRPEGESVAAVASQSAGYFLRITARYPTFEADYQVTMPDLREAEAADRARCEGEHLFAAGEQIYDLRTREGYLAAIEKYQAALPYYEEAEDWFGAARDVMTIGEACSKLTRPYNALRAFEQARSLLLRANESEQGQDRSLRLRAKIENNIGTVYFGWNDKHNALIQFQEAKDRYLRLGDRASEGVLSMNIGNIYAETGQQETGLEWLKDALSISTWNNNESGMAQARNSLGAAKHRQHNYEGAIQDQQAALQLWNRLGDPQEQGATLIHLAANYIELQQPETALEFLNSAMPLIRKGGNVTDEARMLARLGDAYRLLGQLERALEFYRRASELHQTLNEKTSAAYSIRGISRTESLRGNLVEALSQSNRALDLIEQARKPYSNSTTLLSASYSSSVNEYYSWHIGLLLKLHEQDPAAGYDAQAFRASEQAHGRALLESLVDLASDARADAPEGLANRQAELDVEIDQTKKQYMALPMDASEAGREKAKLLEDILRKLTGELEGLQGKMRAGPSGEPSLFQPEPLGLADIQTRLLSPDSLLLEFFVADDRILLFALTNDRYPLHIFEIPDKAAIKDAVDFFTRRRFEDSEDLRERFSFQNPGFADRVQLLSDKLLVPVKSLLKKRRVWIVGDDFLRRVPFAALPDPSSPSQPKDPGGLKASPPPPITPLIKEHEVVQMPSASTAVFLHKLVAGRVPASRGIAVLADPVFLADERVKELSKGPVPEPAAINKRLPGGDAEPKSQDAGRGSGRKPGSLPWTRSEAQEIVRLAPYRSLLALDFDANRELVVNGGLNDYQILHFYTHASMDETIPGLSALSLSQVDRQGRKHPSELRFNDICKLRLKANIVVLAGCGTGTGKPLRGEGVLSLARAFMVAGVPRAIVTLWEVPRAPSELMRIFYRNLLKQKMPFGEALRQAQIEMWKRPKFNEPFFWAAFSLEGDPK